MRRVTPENGWEPVTLKYSWGRVQHKWHNDLQGGITWGGVSPAMSRKTLVAGIEPAYLQGAIFNSYQLSAGAQRNHYRSDPAQVQSKSCSCPRSETRFDRNKKCVSPRRRDGRKTAATEALRNHCESKHCESIAKTLGNALRISLRKHCDI